MDTALTTSRLLPDGDDAEDTIIEDSAHQGRSMTDALEWAMFMPTAVGLLGHFRVEDEGAHAGQFNVRTHGIDPLISSVWAFAASKGILEHNMLKCIFLLRMKRLISADMENALAEAYESFMDHLLTKNVRGESWDNAGWISPSILARHERAKIREAMRTVELFQRYMYEDRIKARSENTIAFESRNARQNDPAAGLSEHNIKRRG